MNCEYCTPTDNDTPYGKPLNIDFENITTKIDSLNGCLSMYGKKDSDMVLINYCPICGTSISENH